MTSLTNFAMPLIRYRIGDMAVFAEGGCNCSRHWPCLSEVVGRLTDVFVRADRGVVSPEYFIHLVGVMLHSPAIRKFQFIQEDYNWIRLLVAPAVPRDEAERWLLRGYRQELETKVKLVMGQECRLDVELVEDIPPSGSGKYRYIISKVTRDA
ncbi:phenylacetate-CoA ligase [Desulfofundulus australicus DSM 11792]|uniref:Phenylacetate-CoA ligase n=1 Tax=Desulfofundulus australicus DSM 11792 TaxID=1121425 RepID=A0A1M4VGC2_9FIRM|nr:hypothetical protein [Desulfofundulus australicus]SHE67988.1 phenylacetate-CoA ligase [Desulfofundulus australicus DSM 11792]